MPVLQGYKVEEYISHIQMYGARLMFGMRVGVGSVCKRNTKTAQVENILREIKGYRPSLKLHGFGLKVTVSAKRCHPESSLFGRQHGMVVWGKGAGREPQRVGRGDGV